MVIKVQTKVRSGGDKGPLRGRNKTGRMSQIAQSGTHLINHNTGGTTTGSDLSHSPQTEGVERARKKKEVELIPFEFKIWHGYSIYARKVI